MKLTQFFPLDTQPVAVPPAAGMIAVLPAALAGSLSVSPLPGRAEGPVLALQPGTQGVVRLASGSTGLPAWVRLSAPADAAGAFIVVCPGSALATEFPPHEPLWNVDRQSYWPWANKGLGLALAKSRAAWLDFKLGSLGALSGAGSVCIRAPLAGTLTLAGNGAPQVLAAGTVGIVVLTQPLAPSTTFAFSSPDDWSSLNDVFVMGQLA